MTNWWNKNVEIRMDDFKSWIGDFNYPSKIYCRNYVVKKKYKSIIDCGCGLATDYFGFKNDNYEIDYTGLDSCKYLVELNKNYGIKMIEAELEKELALPDNSYECVYCREVLEHLSSYEKTISEFVRIATKEVMIVFFIQPSDDEEQINYWETEDLYHNKYNRQKLEDFVKSLDKVDNFFWTEIEDPKNKNEDSNLPDKKSILHIMLKQS